MYPVAKNSKEFKRRQQDFTDDLYKRLSAANQNSMLFGAVPTELHPLLEAGLDELTLAERQTFVSAVHDAQAVLRDHCVKAAFASGRAEYLCPPNAGELIDYTAHRIKVKEKEAEL
jgi:hypothetical protein